MPQKADGIQQIEDATNQANIALSLSLHNVPSADATTNVNIRDVVGNKTDIANETVNVASLVGLLRAALADTTGLNGAVMRGTDNAALASDMAKVPKSDGTVTFNATALASINSEVVNVVETDSKLNKLIVADDRPAATVYPVSVVAESILAFLMSKSASPDASSFNNTTDSLEAIADVVDKIDDGTDGLTAIKAEVEGLAGAAMRGTDNAALAATALTNVTWTNTRAGYLDELAAANIPTDLANLDAKVDALEALFLTQRVIKTVAFDGGAGSGAVGTANLFTVTGGVDYSIEAFCTETLVDAANLATISVGVAGDTAKIIAVTGAAGQGAVTIAANEIWHDAAPDSMTELTSDASKEFTSYGADIIATIAGEAITDGTLVFSVIYTPRTSGAVMEAA